MRIIKESSTHNANRKRNMLQCPVSYVLDKIGGHWKPLIIYHLQPGARRYSELKRAIPTITEKMLIQHLKELEADGLVVRKAKPVVPPYVTYQLSSSGKELWPVLRAMGEWAIKDSKKIPVDEYGVLKGLY
jgi:DNA-binding HxlR family transcriptional regulator